MRSAGGRAGQRGGQGKVAGLGGPPLAVRRRAVRCWPPGSLGPCLPGCPRPCVPGRLPPCFPASGSLGRVGSLGAWVPLARGDGVSSLPGSWVLGAWAPAACVSGSPVPWVRFRPPPKEPPVSPGAPLPYPWPSFFNLPDPSFPPPGPLRPPCAFASYMTTDAASSSPSLARSPRVAPIKPPSEGRPTQPFHSPPM